LWCQGGGNPRGDDVSNEIELSASLDHVTCVKVKAIMPHIAPRKVMEVKDADEVVNGAAVAVTIKEEESLWALATSVASLATRRGTAGSLKQIGTDALTDTVIKGSRTMYQ
jgi:hypothetical protein